VEHLLVSAKFVETVVPILISKVVQELAKDNARIVPLARKDSFYMVALV
jgi:hypothetical protein